MVQTHERTERWHRYWDKKSRSYDREMRFMERMLFGDSRQWACSQARGEVLEVAEVEDPERVGMAQARRVLRLAPEAFDTGRVSRERGMEDLERHLALEVQVPRAIDPAEAAVRSSARCRS